MWSLIPSRASRKAPPVRPSRMLFFCLVGAFLLVLFPHVQQLPLWVTAAVILGMIFRGVGEVYRWRLPSPTFCGILALCLTAAIYFQFGTIFGRDAGTAFMAALLTIKFFELRNSRDIALIIFCSFFVVMSSLLYSQDFELFIYCLIMMWVLTALLLRTTMGDLPDNRLLRLLGAAGLVFLQALPLTLFLFFFFPRYKGKLFIGGDETSIGLTDKVEPGSISRLANDDSTAMTVRITTPGLLAPGTLYWRAMVLWNYQHGIWLPGVGAVPQNSPGGALLKGANNGSDKTQEITIYPHYRRWLFALDYPVGLPQASDGTPGWSESHNGGALEVRSGLGNVDQKERYTVVSSTLLAPQELSPALREAALELPTGADAIDPRVQALAAQLQQGCRNEDDYIRAVLHYFRHEHFLYSEVPGAQGKDALANFLLKSRIGFCEHFASAFAVLMRLGQYPARLVVGYQSAEFNPYDNIFVVKQSNAHAWDEVWIKSEKNWRRVDPTSILSSNETISQSADRAGGLSIEFAGQPYTLIAGSSMPSWLRRTVLEMQLRRQQVESNWNDWVFAYDPNVQGRLAQAMGFHSKTRTLMGLLSLAAIALCGGIFALAMKRRVKISPVEDFYAKFCRSLAQRGAPRSAWEGPLAYTERVAETFPEEKTIIAEAGRIMAATRYSADPPVIASGELKSLLRSLGSTRSSPPAPHES